MPFTHVVVDGSNIATEGRSIPSLVQLDEAVREFKSEYPDAEITVVVDATFGHRIDASEREAFDEAVAHGEMVSPPAGAIGRGDAFLLRIADRSGATVLSNDSFQEFHGEYDWLFTKDRLIGGKPVPAVGWIFTPRTPVRGPKSRESMREARKTRVRVGSKEASRPMPVPKAPPPRPGAGPARSRKSGLSEAIAAATEEVVSPEAPGSSRRRRRRGSGPPTEAVNDPLTFIQFIADHPLGSEVMGEVDSFASHGAFVLVGQARCYLPLSAMGDPPPRSAREVLNRGEPRAFILQALDPQRRGIELALPGYARVAGAPQPETVEAEITEAQPAPGKKATAKKSKEQKVTAKKSKQPKAASKKARDPKRAAKAEITGPAPDKKDRSRKSKPADATAPVETSAPVVETLPVKKADPARKAAAKKTPTKTTSATKAAPARKAAASAKAASAKPAGAKAPPTKQTAARAAPASQATATRKAASSTKAAAAKPATLGSQAPATTKKVAPSRAASARGVPAAKAVAPARKAEGTKKAGPSKKAMTARRSAAQKAAPAKKANPAKKALPAKKTPATKGVAKKAPAKKSPAKRAPAKRAPG
jgi:hypothetical protein